MAPITSAVTEQNAGGKYGMANAACADLESTKSLAASSDEVSSQYWHVIRCLISVAAARRVQLHEAVEAPSAVASSACI